MQNRKELINEVQPCMYSHLSVWVMNCNLFPSFWEIEQKMLSQKYKFHINVCHHHHHQAVLIVLYFDSRPGLKMLFQGDTPEGSDTFQRPVIERDRVGGLRLMIWEKVKVPFCHYSHAPEESNLWTAWQLFPLDDD